MSAEFYPSVDTCALVKAFINTHHGWAVADQFEDTFTGEEPFEEQNGYALSSIREAVDALVIHGILADEFHEELEEYLEKLDAYLSEKV